MLSYIKFSQEYCNHLGEVAKFYYDTDLKLGQQTKSKQKTGRNLEIQKWKHSAIKSY